MPDSRDRWAGALRRQRRRFHTVVARNFAAGLGLDRVLRTGRTERQVVVDGFSADELANMMPHRTLRAEAVELHPGRRAGRGPHRARHAHSAPWCSSAATDARFDDDEVAFAERIAARAAMALASARMYEERSLIASELRAPPAPGHSARDRRRSFGRAVPAGRRAPRYRWRLLRRARLRRRLAVSLGDVCGKGVEAAVLTDRTRQSIRTAAYFDRRPTALLGALNNVLLRGRHRPVRHSRLRADAPHARRRPRRDRAGCGRPSRRRSCCARTAGWSRSTSRARPSA